MMSDSVSFLISELIRAANETSKLTPTGTTRLLLRAAATIRDYREQIAYSESPANVPGQGDIVFDLTTMASAVELFPAATVSAMLLEAAEVIKACKVKR